MPCNGDYNNPSQEEIHGSQVETFIDEIDGLPFDKSNWRGYHPRVYNNGFNYRPRYDKRVELLCSELKKLDPTHYSLELQIWWRDHQAADAAHEEKERDRVHTAEIRLQALAKLTAEEKKVLGIE